MERTMVGKSSALKSYLNLVAALPRLDEAAQTVLELGLLRGDAAASLALTESFLPYVVSEASAQRGRGLRFEALIAAGNRGLAEALRLRNGVLRLRVRREVGRSLREAFQRIPPRRSQAA